MVSRRVAATYDVIESFLAVMGPPVARSWTTAL
jgi:hypothetical protein